LKVQAEAMRAIWMRELGEPSVLVAGDAPDPVAGPGQVVIDVAFANITFVETQLRATGAGPFRAELPMIPGNGVGGVVAAVGGGVDAGMIGRRVVTNTGGSGAYAERVSVDAANLIAVPDEVGLDEATALLADGRTAQWLLATAGVRAGERVLVEAAAGGVGTLTVQVAKAAGAVVIGAAGGQRKVDLVRSLGADVAVDYTRPGWTDDVRAVVGGVDVVLDGVGGAIAWAALGLLDRGGRILSYGAASGDQVVISEDEAADRGVTLVTGPRPTPEEQRALTARALDEAAAGRLRPVIGQRFPLVRAADAHAAIESRATVGKTLLEVARP
jgi:NADPH2:quinone reductase